MRTLLAGSPVSRASSRPGWARRSPASAASGRAGWVAASAAAMLRASGSRAQSRTRSLTAAGSAAIRSLPSRRASSTRASSPPSTSRLTRCAPSAAARPVSWLRLVTRTIDPGVPGSSGRTWAGSRALSSTMSIFRPASRLRYSPVWACGLAGIWSAGTARASSSHRTASPGSTGIAGRVIAAEVQVQLPVGEPVRGLVRPVHGQRGLADPGCSPDRGDDHRSPAGGRLVREPGQGLQFGGPAAEVGDGGRQLVRPRRLSLSRPGRRGGRERLPPQDGQVPRVEPLAADQLRQPLDDLQGRPGFPVQPAVPLRVAVAAGRGRQRRFLQHAGREPGQAGQPAQLLVERLLGFGEPGRERLARPAPSIHGDSRPAWLIQRSRDGLPDVAPVCPGCAPSCHTRLRRPAGPGRTRSTPRGT